LIILGAEPLEPSGTAFIEGVKGAKTIFFNVCYLLVKVVVVVVAGFRTNATLAALFNLN
jgi:hypothetical protein